MRAKQFIRRINEGANDASVITTEVIKLISDGHTEVSPDVITAKVSAALGRPFMLKDLVSANNSSPELQHYIDSINPSKIKFSTDILTVKNEDPMKAKEKAEAGVANMAARAASRPRLGESVNEGWATGSDRVSLPDEPSTYWAGKGALQADYNRLYDELVPSQGKADTIEGEVLRASSKIVYRHYNDGDEFNQASFDQLEPYIGAVTSYDDLAHKAVEFAVKANGNYTPNPNWDSLDAMDYGPVDDGDDYDEDDDWEDEWSDDIDDEEDEDLEEAWQDGADLISQWNIPQQEWAQFEDAVESVIAATESDEAWEQFWTVIKDDLQYLDRPVREAFERGLGSMDVSETTEYVLNGLRNGYESAGTEPRAALGLLTDIIEDGVRKLGVSEGWESGPDERASRERDPDWEYDQRRQEKMDIEAEKAQAQRPQEQYYTLVGRGPNYEANYAFPGEYATQDEAVAARAKLMADPSTPNPRDIGISKRTRYLDIKEGRETPLRDLEDYQAKKKALQDIQSDPSTAQDLELSAEVIRRLAGLEQQRKDLK